MKNARDILNMFVALVATGCTFLVVLDPEKGPVLKGILTQGVPAVIVILLAGMTWLLNLAQLWAERHDFGLGRHVDIVTENGMNSISLTALETQFLDQIKAFPDVSDAHVSMIVSGDAEPVRCDLSFKLLRQENVVGRMDVIKTEVRTAFERLIPAGAGIEITANVTGLVSRDQAANGAAEFSGPVYPIGLDSEEERL